MKKKIAIFLVLISFSMVLYSCDTKNSSQLLDILNSLEYEYYGYYSSGHLPITEDIQINGTVVISSAQLKIPKECLDRQDCRHSIGFSDEYGTDGISVIPDLGYFNYPPGTLILTNVKLRFRTLLIDTHPDQYNFVPVIQLMPSSDYECEESDVKCANDQVCYGTSDRFCSYCSYCQNCLGISHQECVCQDEDGKFPDGTFCQFFVSGDAIMMGECQDGECIPEYF